ncbi:MAG: arginine decarboxylase, pyruvoyl-dependent [Candidatus Saganbacteria bacterium]|nr:arginine decarboxylase, pyruvoyl-dependent [Candidatus Saganbacteria bacterium]
MIPRKVFLTKGVGRHKEKLSAFEMALRDAEIAAFNLVRVSSIFPPYCQLVSKKNGMEQLNAGQIVFCVLAENATSEPNRLVSSSIGLAIPADRSRYGYLSEHHTFGESEKQAGDYSEDLAASMLATILGISYDENVSYDVRKKIWKMRNEIVRTTNITQSAVGDKNGLWTTVIAAAVMVP